jgi:hypothetical protein
MIGVAKMARTKVGAVITFPEHLTRRQVEQFLLEWQSELAKDDSEFVYDSIQIGEYDPEVGGPVFYVP